VQVSGLSDVRVAVQESLFGETEVAARDAKGPPQPSRAKLERVTEGIDKLRSKFGRTAVVRASLLGRERLKGRDGIDSTPAE